MSVLQLGMHLLVTARNIVGAVDFQLDVEEQTKSIKIFSLMDEHTRECLDGLVERSITADRFIDHFEGFVIER